MPDGLLAKISRIQGEAGIALRVLAAAWESGRAPTPAEIAEKAGCSRQLVYKLLRSGFARLEESALYPGDGTLSVKRSYFHELVPTHGEREFTDIELSRQSDPRYQPRERSCMCCRRTFKSKGIYNRLCNSCLGRQTPPV